MQKRGRLKSPSLLLTFSFGHACRGIIKSSKCGVAIKHDVNATTGFDFALNCLGVTLIMLLALVSLFAEQLDEWKVWCNKGKQP